jgi:hypothetical protein
MFNRRGRLDTSRLAKKRRKRMITRAIFYGVSALCLILLVIWFFHNQNFKINDIEVRGNILVSSADVVNLVKKEISGDYLWVFPKNNSFIYPRSAIKGALLQNFKRLKDVKVGLIPFSGVGIDVTERQPYALWCRSEDGPPPAKGLVRASKEACYFLDQGGLIYAEAPVFSGDAYFRYYGRFSSTSPSSLLSSFDPVGSQFMDEARFKEVGFFIKSLETIGVKAKKFTYQFDGDYEVAIDNGARLLLTDKVSFGEELDNLTALLNDPNLKVSNPGFLNSVDYIDLRFGNKIFYKPR